MDMNMKIDEVERSSVKLEKGGLKAWYEKEEKRVSDELDRTKLMLSNMTTSVVDYAGKEERIAELKYAIAVGTIYFNKVKDKVKKLTK